MVHLDRCAWKKVDSDKFVLGQDAERCGEVAREETVNNFKDSWETRSFFPLHRTRFWGALKKPKG